MWGKIEFAFTFPNAEPFSSTQYTSSGSNDDLALIARGLFDTFQDSPSGSAPSTSNETPGDARPVRDASDVKVAKSTSLSSIATTSATQGGSQPSVTTLSAVEVPRPSSEQHKVAEQDWVRYPDW